MEPADLPDIGKISPEIFAELICPRLGARDDSVIVGPQSGVDVGIVRIGDKAVALTTDPFFIVPQYGWERAAWFAVHILLSDAVTSGLPPRYMTVDLNLPLSMDREGLDQMWGVVHRECEKYGVAIVTGHTARYQGCDFPMVGGATVICVGPADSWVGPSFARPGDAIIITKGPAIETTGLFVAALPRMIERRLGADFLARAQDVFWMMSVVDDARIAVAQGVREQGVSCMHDATECGIYGALWEIADAAGLGLIVDRDAIVTVPECIELCAALDLDPYACISEGTLVLTCRPQAADRIVEALEGAGIPASVCGQMRPREEGIRIIEGGVERDLQHTRVDPFWQAFGRALAEEAL